MSDVKFINQLIKMITNEPGLFQFKHGVLTMPRRYMHYNIILAKYFRTSRLSSFQRQLTNYGFTLIKNATNYIYLSFAFRRCISVRDKKEIPNISRNNGKFLSTPRNYTLPDKTPGPVIPLTHNRVQSKAPERILHPDCNETLELLETIWARLFYDR